MECHAGSRNPGISFTHMARVHRSFVNIQAAVRSKISRERVGVEIDKMLKGMLYQGSSVPLLSSTTARNPLLSLEMIDSLSLYDSVLWLPPAMLSILSGQPASRSRGLVAAGILESLLSRATITDSTATRPLPRYALPQTHPTLLTHASDPNVRRRLFLAAALTPFKGITLPDKKRAVPAAEAVIREGLKVRAFAAKRFTITQNPSRSTFYCHSSEHRIIIWTAYLHCLRLAHGSHALRSTVSCPPRPWNTVQRLFARPLVSYLKTRAYTTRTRAHIGRARCYFHWYKT
jgi:hypothetical protein